MRDFLLSYLDDGEGRWAGHERRPSTECNLPPAIIAAIIAAGAAATAGGVGAGGASAANKATGLKDRIKNLEEAQAAGRLTREGEMIATTGQEQAKIAQEEALRKIAAQQGAVGVTSGADMAAMDTARVRAERDAASQAAQAFAGQFAAEGQSLFDLKELKRARDMEIVNFISQGISGGAQAFGAGAGYTAQGKPADLDVSGTDKETQEAYEAYKASGMDDSIFDDPEGYQGFVL